MKLILHPLFFAVIAIAVFTGFGVFAVTLLLAVLVHEFSHACVAASFGVHTRQLRLLPFGAEIEIDCAYLTTRQQILVLLAGSFGNIVLTLIAGGLLWVLPGFFTALEYIIIANAVPAILNLLPIYPLDGGKILYVLAMSKDKAKAEKLVKLLYLTSSAFFIAVAVFCSLVVFNVAVLVLCGAMLWTFAFEFKSTRFVSKINSAVKTSSHKVIDVAVRSDMSLLEVFKLASPRHYTKFIITDKNNLAFYESRLEQVLMKYSLQTKLQEVHM